MLSRRELFLAVFAAPFLPKPRKGPWTGGVMDEYPQRPSLEAYLRRVHTPQTEHYFAHMWRSTWVS